MSALCSIHLEAAAAGTCERCGRFACAACLSGTWCNDCEPKRWGEWNDGPFSLEVVLGQGVQLFIRNAPVAFALAAIAAAMDVGVGLLPVNGAIAVQLVFQTVFGSFSTAYFVLTLHATVLGRPRGFRDIFGDAVGRTGAVILASILIGLGVGVGLIACIVPGLMAAAALALTQQIAVLEPGRGAVRESFELTDGHRLSLGVVMLIIIGGYLIIAIAPEVLWLVLAPKSWPSWPMDLPRGLARGLLSALGDAVLYCCWLRLRHPRNTALLPAPAAAG